MIKSIVQTDTEAINAFRELYGIERFDLDPTFSKGNFYKDIPRPKQVFDINALFDFVGQASANDLPLDDQSVGSIVFDPPFLATTGESLSGKSGNIINKRFTVFRSEKALHRFYVNCLTEFYRLLRPDGFVFFKCMDKVSSGKQYLSHVFIINEATEIGFYPRDLFILVAKNRLISPKHKHQKHARKFHSYWLVLQKCGKKIVYM